MTEIVGVGFIKASKTYYFDPKGEKFKIGELVIVETARGLEMGHISIENREVEDSEIVAPLKPIERRATKADLAKYRENQSKRASAMKVCDEKIRKHKLQMKLVDAEYTIDGTKVIFYFSADGRIDFRELVKDLASHFRMRIELRQIGVRDEARMLGGIGICGRPFCCSRWLHDFQPVSIKMAKQQNLSLNPSKISGSCGRLMCCLNFENKTYQELRKGMPNEGERIQTPEGLAKVVSVDLFNGRVNARLFEKNRERDNDRDKTKGREKEKDRNRKSENNELVLSQEIKTYFKQEIRRVDKKPHKKNKGEAEDVDAETLRELEKLTRD